MINICFLILIFIIEGLFGIAYTILSYITLEKYIDLADNNAILNIICIIVAAITAISQIIHAVYVYYYKKYNDIRLSLVCTATIRFILCILSLVTYKNKTDEYIYGVALLLFIFNTKWILIITYFTIKAIKNDNEVYQILV